MTPETLTLISLLIHVPVVVAWIVFASAEAALASPRFLVAQAPLRFAASLRIPTLVLLLIIFVTGIRQTMDNPFVPVDSIETLEKLRNTTTYGMALFIKHIWVFATVGLSIALRFWLAPRLLARGETQPTRLFGILAWLNVAACVLTLLATTRMLIQLH
ncbi:MAG: hypothetical protein DWI48_02730 [Chloroflexi bacterium]|nr:MAG: hypothetical protein DWI48_02730 [Chloroflexota bacterium]